MKAHLARLNGIILAEAETARFNPLTDPFATGISATYPCLQYLITERAFESLSELGCGQRMGPLRGWVIGLLTTILEVVPAQEILPMIRTSLSKVILTSHMYNPPRLLFDLDGDREIGDEEEEEGYEGAGAKKGTEEGTLLLTLVRLVADMVGERPPLSAYLFDGEVKTTPRLTSVMEMPPNQRHHFSLCPYSTDSTSSMYRWPDSCPPMEWREGSPWMRSGSASLSQPSTQGSCPIS
jgi:hypothetical protein